MCVHFYYSEGMKFLLTILLIVLFSCQDNKPENTSLLENSADSTQVAYCFERANLNRDSSAFYYEQAKKVMLKNGSQGCLANFLFLAGKRKLMVNELDSVVFFADSGLRIPFVPENTFYKGKFYNLKANVAGFKRNIYQSLDLYTKAEKVFVETNDSNSLAGIYSNITNSYFSLKDYTSGLEYSTKAYNLLETVQEDRIKTNILITHSLSLAKNHRLSEALIMQLKADSISQITQDAIAKMSVAIGYAEIYKSSNQLDSARVYYRKCIELSRLTGVKHFELMSNVGLLSLYEESNETAQIIEEGENVLLLAKMLNNLDVIQTSKRIISRAYAKNKNYEKAFHYLNDSYQIYDSTAGIENQKNINELRVKYNLAKSEKENLQQKLLLTKQNLVLRKSRLTVIIFVLLFVVLLGFFLVWRKLNQIKSLRENLQNQQKIQSAIIDGEEKERKRLAFEIHDGIASMVTGITYKVESSLSEKVEILGLLNQLHEDSRNIAHNLMPINFLEQNLLEAIATLCAKMSSKEVEVILMTKEKTIDLGSEKSHLLYRILQELINNALKHANCNSIFVKIEINAETVRFAVEDDGQGLTEENVKNGFVSIRERVKLLKGTLLIHENKTEGTEIEITLVND